MMSLSWKTLAERSGEAHAGNDAGMGMATHFPTPAAMRCRRHAAKTLRGVNA